jgi:GT2 family glycosyltransferase
MEDWPKVAIIILNWNGWHDTIECLESLYRIIYQNYQVILVDNGSTNKSVDKIKDWARGDIQVNSPFIVDSVQKPITVVEYSRAEAVTGGSELMEAQIEQIPSASRLILISNETNLGFAAGSNVGLHYALQRDYRYLGLLNNDTIVTPNYLCMLVQTLQDDSSLAGVSPKILHKNNPMNIRVYPD